MENSEMNPIKVVHCTIKGLSPLLMNRPDLSRFTTTESYVKKSKEYNTMEEAEKGAYRDDKGYLAIPAYAVHRCMINASSGYKAGKKSITPYISGSISVMPEMISLGVKEFETDVRTVVIQKARVVKARPKVSNWAASLELHYDSRDIVNSNALKEILSEAGRRVGLLDYRPQTKGPFGRFEVIEWYEE